MAFVLLAALMPAQPVPVFEANTAVVYLDVFVTRDGEPVRGLGAEHFEVTDEGVRQSLEMVSLEDVPLDLFLVFDVSRSLKGQRLDDLRRAARVVLAELRPGDRAGLFTFSDEVRLALPRPRTSTPSKRRWRASKRGGPPRCTTLSSRPSSWAGAPGAERPSCSRTARIARAGCLRGRS